MRLYIIALVLILISSCQNNKQRKYLFQEDLKYSAYCWHITDSGPQFYLAHYLDLDKNGHYVGMRHITFLDEPKYFEGNLKDSVLQLINLLLDSSYKKSYDFKKPEVYDGFTYSLDYKKQTGENVSIKFIPEESPIRIKELSMLLDSVIFLKTVNKIPAFSIDAYVSQLKKDTLIFPFLIHEIKFIPPIIK